MSKTLATVKPEDIRRVRESMGLTQAEFAARVGVGGTLPNFQLVSKWESGTVPPSTRTCVALERLGVLVAWPEALRDPRGFGRRLLAWLVDTDRTTKGLAAELGAKQSTAYKWMMRGRCKPSTLQRLKRLGFPGEEGASMSETGTTDVATLRAELGWTQQQLARQLSVSKWTVGQWERGAAKPSRKNALRLRQLGIGHAATAPSVPAEPAPAALGNLERARNALEAKRRRIADIEETLTALEIELSELTRDVAEGEAALAELEEMMDRVMAMVS